MRINGKFVAAVVILVLLSSFAYAQSQNYSQIFDPLFDLFDYIFNQLGTQIVFRKFLLWMLLFALLTTLVKNLPFLKDQTENRRGNVIAFALSLIMVLGIPTNVINLIYDQYALITAIALYLLVPALLFYATKDVQSSLIRGILFLGLGILLLILSNSFSAGPSNSMRFFINWMRLGAAILMLVGLIMILSGGFSAARGGLGFGFNPLNRRAPGAIPTPATPPPAAFVNAGNALDVPLRAAQAAVRAVYDKIHTQLIVAGNTHLINNANAIRDNNATAQAQNNNFATNFHNVMHSLIMTDFANAVNAIAAVRGHAAIGSITAPQATALTNLSNELIAYADDVADYYTVYAQRLARAQEPP